jgi:hypothetical protein
MVRPEFKITNPFKGQTSVPSAYYFHTRNWDMSICVKFSGLESKTGTHVFAMSHGQVVPLISNKNPSVTQSESLLLLKCVSSYCIYV